MIFDTAPTGHTLRLIRMPELMEAWIRALTRSRRAMLGVEGDDKDDPILRVAARSLRAAAGAARAADRRPHDRVRAGADSRAAADRGNGARAGAARRDRREGRRPGGEPRAARTRRPTRSCRHAARRSAIYLDEIAARFADRPRVYLPQFPRDVYGLASLGPMAEALAAATGVPRMTIAKPQPGDYAPFYQAYIDDAAAAGDDALAISRRPEARARRHGDVARSQGRPPLRRGQVDGGRGHRPHGRRRARVRLSPAAHRPRPTPRRWPGSTRTPSSCDAGFERRRWPASSPSCAPCATSTLPLIRSLDAGALDRAGTASDKRVTARGAGLAHRRPLRSTTPPS